MRTAELDDLAVLLGAGSAGVVTAAGLRLAGADPDAVKRALATRWQTPVRGVYSPHRRPLSDEELAHVAVAHAGAGSVLTGLAAARALRLRWVPDLSTVMVLVEPERRRASSEGLVLVRRCAGLPTMPTSRWCGLPVAPVAQVVADACRQIVSHRRAGHDPAHGQAWLDEVYLREARGVVLGAVADQRCTVEELRAVIEAGAMRDSAVLRRVCRDAARGAASPPEAELVDGLVGLGVPFWCNVEVRDDAGPVAVLDVYLVGTGVGAEMDSRQEHGSEQQLDATLRRHRRVQMRGVELLHVTPTRYRSDPEAFHRELVSVARARLSRGLGDPPGLRFVPRGVLLSGPRTGRPPYTLPGLVINRTSSASDAA